MNTIFAAGLSGMQAAQTRLDVSAGRVARWGTGSGPGTAAVGDLAADLVGQRLDATLYTANLRTVQVADRVLGSLLDAVA
jgi:flagellar hook protein FlgE